MKEISLRTEELRERARELRAGDRVLLSGIVYTARDAAHKRLVRMIEAGEDLPFAIRDAVIYYAGPTPAPPGRPIGSCGPTTSGRMDPYTPRLLDLGLVGIIGKGARNEAVRRALRRKGAVYFCAVGGAGALYADRITACETVAFEDLGCESVKRLTVCGMPLTVGEDPFGGSLFFTPET